MKTFETRSFLSKRLDEIQKEPKKLIEKNVELSIEDELKGKPLRDY